MQTPLWVFLMVLSLLGDRDLVPESLAFAIVIDILSPHLPPLHVRTPCGVDACSHHHPDRPFPLP
jgi:hypothetical protein